MGCLAKVAAPHCRRRPAKAERAVFLLYKCHDIVLFAQKINACDMDTCAGGAAPESALKALTTGGLFWLANSVAIQSADLPALEEVHFIELAVEINVSAVVGFAGQKYIGFGVPDPWAVSSRGPHHHTVDVHPQIRAS